MTTFQRLAEPKLEDYRQTVATGAERMADLKAQLDGLAEAAPEQAALELEYATAETSVRTAKHRLESFDRLLAES